LASILEKQNQNTYRRPI